MKLTSLTFCLLFFSSVLSYNMTYMLSAKPHETKSVTIYVPAGWSSIEAWGTDNEIITCTFVDPVTKNVIYEIVNTKLCITNNASRHELSVILQIKNTTEKSAQLRAWVHDYK